MINGLGVLGWGVGVVKEDKSGAHRITCNFEQIGWSFSESLDHNQDCNFGLFDHLSPNDLIDNLDCHFGNELVCCGVLSGNRHFEGRLHPNTRASYLASPLLVIVYALAGRVDIDFDRKPIAMFKDVYSRIEKGSSSWQNLQVSPTRLYQWDSNSTYVKRTPFFEGMTKDLPELKSVKGARVLLFLGDSVTTDHISPAGTITRNSPAARYLASRGLIPKDFNSYGSRRGNDEIMMRGTFANIRLVIKFMSKPGPMTKHIPSNVEGVKAINAESYERIHRSNLVGMGIIPLQFLPGENAESLNLTGQELYDVHTPENCVPLQNVTVKIADNDRSFEVILRFDTEVELMYHKHGGILNCMIRKMLN